MNLVLSVQQVFDTIYSGGVFEGNDKKFDVCRHFISRMSPQISYVGKKFKENFYGKILPPCGKFNYMAYSLQRATSAEELEKIFGKIKENLHGISQVTYLQFIWSLLMKQPHKDFSGILATSGKANLFQTDCGDGPKGVSIFWRETFWNNEAKCQIKRGWNVRSYSSEQMADRKWNPGSRIFVRI